MQGLVLGRKKISVARERALRAVKFYPGHEHWSGTLKGACGWPRGGIKRSLERLKADGLIERKVTHAGYFITGRGEDLLKTLAARGDRR